MIKRFIIAFLLILFATFGIVSYAMADIVLNVHVGSYHDGPGYWDIDTGELTPYNQTNTGGGLSFTFNNYSEVRGGGYKNSHYGNSFYLGGAVYTNSRRFVSFGLVGGLVTGYADQIQNPTIEYSNVQPFIVPTIFFNIGPARLEIGHVPAIGDSFALTTFTTGFRF